MPFEETSLLKMSEQARSYDVKSSATTDKLDSTIRKLVSSGHPVLKGAAESAAKSFAAYYLVQPGLSIQLVKDATSTLGHALGLPKTWELPTEFELKKPPSKFRR